MEASHRRFRFRAGALSCTVLQLFEAEVHTLEQDLADTVKQAPDFFRGVPVVIDLEQLAPEVLPDFAHLKSILRQNGLIPVGVRQGTEAQQAGAAGEGLYPLSTAASLSRSTRKDASPDEKDEKEEKKATSTSGARVVTQPVRSGTQLYARDSDLVVMASVSPGAELLADGHIHVYGSLKGRVLAGVHGNRDARIFCTRLSAELVSIAGFYLTQDDMQKLPENHGMIQVYLDGEQVRIEPVLQSHFA